MKLVYILNCNVRRVTLIEIFLHGCETSS